MKITTRPVSPLLCAIAVLVAAGGYVHLREWLGSYRFLPSAVPGAAVVKVGFPVAAAISAVLAVVLIDMALRRQEWNRTAAVVIGATAVFQALSLTVLILSRTDSVFGWSETAWTRGAGQIRAVEVGALICLAQVAGLRAMMRPRGVASRATDQRAATTTP
jgi:protein-S-isoprenylcysteine O-methyltransferase Ste14